MVIRVRQASCKQEERNAMKKETMAMCASVVVAASVGCIVVQRRRHPAKEWYKPEYANKQSHTQFALVEEEASDENNESRMAFSGAKIIKKVEETDPEPEVILDSGSTITLVKRDEMLDNIKDCKVVMCSNG